ncbi:MAG: hypothetical protein P8Y63_03140 [Deltaproteobacteria bacterium]|jgi:hypothetical protein
MPKKVDILGDVLTNSDERTIPGLMELSDLITPEKTAQPKRPTQPESPFQLESPAQQKKPAQLGTCLKVQSSKGKALRKKKVSLYLSPEIAESIDRILPRIRNLAPEKARKRVSKSSLVNFSLQLLLREYEEKGKESLLVRQFLHDDRDGNDS